MTIVQLANTESDFNPVLIKSRFPVFLANPNTRDLAYLDNAATTQKPDSVIKAMQAATEDFHAPVNRGFYAMAEQSSQVYQEARERLAEFIGAKDASSIVFTASATDSINLVAKGYLANRLNKGDVVWVSRMEHHANYLPWLALCEQYQAELKIIELNDKGELDLENVEGLYANNTALIAITHTSNVTGTTNDIEGICEQAASNNIPVLIDAAQAMVSNRIDVSDLDCAFLTFSAHKMFGPTGIGMLYISPDYVADMQPVRLGGGMVDFVGKTMTDTQWTEVPHCFEAGSPNLTGAVGFAKACDFVDQLDQTAVKNHLTELSSYLYEHLSSFEGLTIVTPRAHLSSGIVSFYHDSIHAHDLAQILGDEGVAVRAGHHCAQPLLDYLQTSSTLRVSCSVYNQRQDIDKVIDALHKAEEIFA